MACPQMEEEIREARLSGYRHHPYALEQQIARMLREGTWDGDALEQLNLQTYADILAPDRLRAMKNSLICLVAVMSRASIGRGVDPERSFTASDHYINRIEACRSSRDLQDVLRELVKTYSGLEKSVRHPEYPAAVRKAVEYIEEHLYGPCRVSEVAEAVGYDPQYLAGIFREAVGQPPLAYIRQRKLREARELLKSGCAVGEVAQSLGYCNASYFIREFTACFGISPGKARREDKL